MVVDFFDVHLVHKGIFFKVMAVTPYLSRYQSR